MYGEFNMSGTNNSSQLQFFDYTATIDVGSEPMRAIGAGNYKGADGALEGFRIYANLGTLSGKVLVYGLNNSV